MNHASTLIKKIGLPLLYLLVLGNLSALSQEGPENLGSNNTYHNQMFFNRFLINPTFSLVRENKSYLNILHRNQYATFEDNTQNYFLGFSNRINDRTAVGIGVYSQWSGVVQEFGFNANYATSVQLGEKSALAFGANITYFNQGLDRNRVIVGQNDPQVAESIKESKIAVQPGVNLSLGKFDFGLYAQDMLRYNQTTNAFFTNLNMESLRASVQYTHTFNAGRGLFENARFMPLLQMGQHMDGRLAYLGSVLLDLPHYGWLQTTVDDQYGISAGVGFNVGKRMSLGYLMEKDMDGTAANLGWNHELSLAYTFKEADTYGDAYVDSSTDSKIDRIVRNYEEQIAALMAERNEGGKRTKKQDLQSKLPTESASSLAYENRLILDELILRQDSLEEARTAAFEQKFETVVRMLRNDVKNSIRSNLEEFSQEQNVQLATNGLQQDIQEAYAQEQKQKYAKMPIRVLGDADDIGVKSGYYVIANVYSNPKYLKAFMDDLKRKGIAAKQFYNKENGLHYVYLADYDYKQDAQTAYVSHLNGKYTDEKWIMQVDDHSATASNTFEDEGF
jgi:type IX secretion system PorP/SprF family membrane protein